MLFNETKINDENIPNHFIEIASLLKLNQKETHKKMIKLLHQNFDEDCDENEKILMEILEYAVFLGGILHRALFVKILGEMFSISKNQTSIIASIVEMMHVYTIMLNDIQNNNYDDYINDRENCCKKFGKFQTIIASNALNHLLIETISNNDLNKFTDGEKYKIIKIISKYCGKNGICGGQMMKVIINNKKHSTNDENTRIKKLQINSLFNAGAECIEMLAKTTTRQNTAIKNYINNFCHLINLYKNIEDWEINKDEILQRADMFAEQGCLSVSKLKNNEKLISFINYNNYCMQNEISKTYRQKPIIIQSDIVNIQ